MKLKILQMSFLTMVLWVFGAFIQPCRTALFAAEKFMDVDEIKAGMKGYGRTVFTGDVIETFDVEVLGILRNWEAKSNMVLIRMSGGPLEKSGIIAGMSGSPVYIDDRLIGAVAYGWSFAKEAIAGVTPINEMKDTLLNIPIQENGNSPDPAYWELPPSLHNDDITAPHAVYPIQKEEILPVSNNIRLTSILSPLVISGIDGGVLQRMQTLFNAYGLYPIQGGSYGSHAKELPGEGVDRRGDGGFVPGASVAAILIKGDLSAAVVGTVTYVEGNKVLAFGHPFLQTGNTDIPMASAYVYTILTSQSNSVKMASPVKIVGQINQDRRAGIAGIIGGDCKMIPCHIEVEGLQKSEYNFEIVDNKLLTPSLVMMAAQSAVLSTEKRLGEKSVNLKLSIKIDGYEKPIVAENVFYELDQTWFPINHIIQPFTMVLNNQFQKVRVSRIDLKIRVSDVRRTAHIESVKVDKKHVKPGDSLQIDVRIKPFTGESVYQTVMIKIPEDTLPGSVLNVTACDAVFGQTLNMGRAPGKYLPANFEQLLRYIENMEQNNTLMVRILLPKKGLTYKGEGFPSLPASVFTIMGFPNQSGVGPLFDEVISRVQTPYVLNGNQSIQVLVK